MRATREERERMKQDIAQNFQAEAEGTFRRVCPDVGAK